MDENNTICLVELGDYSRYVIASNREVAVHLFDNWINQFKGIWPDAPPEVTVVCGGKNVLVYDPTTNT